MSFRDSRAARKTAGALLWLVCFQYFVAEQIARVAWTLPYSMKRNYISDLGAIHCGTAGLDPVCSPLHWVMNSSFVLQGLLIFFGALLVRRLFPTGTWITISLVMITLSGIGILVVGLAPEDARPAIHYAAAAEHFLLDNAGMALLGAILLLRTKWPRFFALYSLVSGLIGLGATLLLSQRIFLGLQVGGMERVAAYPFPLWLSLTGIFLLLRMRQGKAARV
jgi:hypothetical membrane protein